MRKITTLVTGIVFGIAFVGACGGGGGIGGVSPSLAESIGAALDVIFNNAKSGLVANNVQDALDELATRELASSPSIVGSWTFTEEHSSGGATSCYSTDGTAIPCDPLVNFTTSRTMTFNSDGTFSMSPIVSTAPDGTIISYFSLCENGAYTDFSTMVIFSCFEGTSSETKVAYAKGVKNGSLYLVFMDGNRIPVGTK